MSESHDDVNPTEEGGVVLSNPDLAGLGWLISYCVYDGSVSLEELRKSLVAGASDGQKALYKRTVPEPRRGGSAFSRAVKALETKQQLIVHDDPDAPLTNNKEKMRVKSGGAYGYRVQWNIVTLRRNVEYVLKRTRRGYVEGQPRVQVVEEPLYRIRVSYPSRKFARQWRTQFVNFVWGIDNATRPSEAELRQCVVVEPMQEGSMPNNARFMRLAQERLRDAFVQASTSIDDDLMRAYVRTVVTNRWNGVLSSGSSGASYFVHDPSKTLRDNIEALSDVLAKFAELGNGTNQEAMWVETLRPWWQTNEEGEVSGSWENVPTARYRSTLTSLVYGSSQAQMRDIRNSFISGLQKSQQNYYQAVRKMLQEGEVDLDVIKSLRAQVEGDFTTAVKVVGKESMEEALSGYSSYVPYLADRLSQVLSPEDEEREEAVQEASELLGFGAMLDRL